MEIWYNTRNNVGLRSELNFNSVSSVYLIMLKIEKVNPLFYACIVSCRSC